MNNINYYRDAQNLPYYLQLTDRSLQPSNETFKEFCEKYIDNDANNTKDEKTRDYEREFYEFLKGKVNDFLGKSRNTSYDHIVLLLGAGASVVEGKNYGKTMGQLAWKIFNRISQKNYGKEITLDNGDLLSYREVLKFIPDSEKITLDKDTKEKIENFPEPKDVSVKWKGTFPLEELISQLDFYIKGNEQLLKLSKDESKKKHFKRVCNTKNYIIYEIFKNVKYDNLSEDNEFPFNHMAVVLALTKLLKSLSEKLTVVTTNYDLAIESSLDKRDFTVFSGFNLTDDSIFDESSFDWVLSKKVNHINTEEVIYKPNMINLFKIHGSINWIFDGANTKEVPIDRVEQILLSNVNSKNNSEKSSKDKKDEVRMIFPSTNKYMQSYEEPYFDLMARFQEELHKSNTLLVTSGFSFGDDHISRMVINAIKHNSSLKCLFTDYGIYNSEFYKYLETDSNKEKSTEIDNEKLESEENLYGNKNWRELDLLRNEGYDIAFLKATMNDKEHGLAFFLRG